MSKGKGKGMQAAGSAMGNRAATSGMKNGAASNRVKNDDMEEDELMVRVVPPGWGFLAADMKYNSAGFTQTTRSGLYLSAVSHSSAVLSRTKVRGIVCFRRYDGSKVHEKQAKAGQGRRCRREEASDQRGKACKGATDSEL